MLYLRALRGIVDDNPWRVKDDEAWAKLDWFQFA